MAEAGSSPTSTVASPGGRPSSRVSVAASSRTRSRTPCATALPSITVAAIASARLPQRCVVGHQLALRALAGEANDDHAAGLHRGDYALAEAGVDDVIAGGEAGNGP